MGRTIEAELTSGQGLSFDFECELLDVAKTSPPRVSQLLLALTIFIATLAGLIQNFPKPMSEAINLECICGRSPQFSAPDFRVETRRRWCDQVDCLFVLAVISGCAGLWLGLLCAPASAQQGETYRIMLVHVPSAWLSMLLYLLMVAWVIASLLRPNLLSWPVPQAMAPTGALMTLLSLGTGALWGQPTWGTWWVWDARLTAQLILFFLYIAFIVLTKTIADRPGTHRTGAMVLLVGTINIPVIHFSVHWWHSLHQGATIRLGQPISLSPLMLGGVFLMLLCFMCYAAAMTRLRLRCLMLERRVLES